MARLIEKGLQQADRSVYEPVDITLEDLFEIEVRLSELRNKLVILNHLELRVEDLESLELESFADILADEISFEDKKSLGERISKAVRNTASRIEKWSNEFFDKSEDKAKKITYKGDELLERIRRFEKERARDEVKVTHIRDLHISRRFDARTISSGLQSSADTMTRLQSQFMESTNSIYDKISDQYDTLKSKASGSEKEKEFNALNELIGTITKEISDRCQRYWDNIEQFANHELSGGRVVDIISEARRSTLPTINIKEPEEQIDSSVKITTPDLRDIRQVIEASQACAAIIENGTRDVRRIIERNAEMLKLGDDIGQAGFSDTVTSALFGRIPMFRGEEKNQTLANVYRSNQVQSIRNAQTYLLRSARAGLKYAEKALNGYE